MLKKWQVNNSLTATIEQKIKIPHLTNLDNLYGKSPTIYATQKESNNPIFAKNHILFSLSSRWNVKKYIRNRNKHNGTDLTKGFTKSHLYE